MTDVHVTIIDVINVICFIFIVLIPTIKHYQNGIQKHVLAQIIYYARLSALCIFDIYLYNVMWYGLVQT